MEAFLNDLRYALRGLLRRPGFTLVAVLTLALGMGANTAIFSLVHGVILKPLGYPDEDRLVAVAAIHSARGAELNRSFLPDFWHWREQSRSFDEMAFYGWWSMTLQEPGQVQQIRSLIVSANYLRLLGMKPHLGRLFAPQDEIAGRGRVALIGWPLWQRVWGGDAEIVGRTIRLAKQTVTVIGVMPAGIQAPSPRADLWLPVGYLPGTSHEFGREERDVHVMGLLKQEVTLAQAQAEMSRLASQLAQQFPATNEDWGVSLMGLRQYLSGSARAPLWIAFCAVTLVLLIASANIANLLLARALSRRREVALRIALGAGGWPILRQLLAESLLLSAAGCLSGLLLASWLRQVLLALEPGILPRKQAIGLDTPVLVFALVAGLGTALVLGLITALRSNHSLADSLKESGSRSAGMSRGHNRMRMALVGGEMALSLTLLASSSLLVEALFDLQRVRPGFEPEGRYTSHIVYWKAGGDLEARRHYFKRILEEVRAIPGIQSAGLTTTPPVAGMGIQIEVPYRGESGPQVSEPGAPRSAFRIISPGYLETVGIPLLAGRGFDDHDSQNAPMAVLVNRTLAGRAWPGEDPIGKRLTFFLDETIQAEVIGVVGDTRSAGLHLAPRPALYLVHPQLPFLGMGVVARSEMAPAAVEEAIRRAVLSVEATVPVNNFLSLADELSETLATERFFAAVLGLFSVLALLLSAAGVYGVFSCWVGQRTCEIGVRMALGARSGQVMGLVVGRAMRLTVAGLAAGLAGALASAQLLSRVFNGVQSLNLATLFCTAAALAGVALLACYLPARRASRVHPIEALRAE